MSQKEIVVSNKHIKLRVALTISFFVIAIVAIIIGISSIGDKDPGVYEVTPKIHDDYPNYGNGFKGVFDFTEGDTKLLYKQYEEEMSKSLQMSYALFDETKVYTSYNSISSLALHPNEEMTLSDITYSTLEDALAKTNESKNYSIYSAPIYAYWDWLYSLDEENRELNDPKNNPISMELLNKLVGFCNGGDIQLNLLGDNKAKLVVSQEYLNFREQENITAPLVSLNVLKDAYRMELLVKAFKDKGYTNGYLYHESDIYVSLENHKEPVYRLYDSKGNDPINYAYVRLEKPSCSVSLKRFKSNSSDYVPFYSLQDGTKRNSYINLTTGFGNTEFVSTTFFGKNDSEVVDLMYLSNYINALDSNSAKSTLNDKYWCFTVNENPSNAYVSSGLEEYITINSNLGYNLLKF